MTKDQSITEDQLDLMHIIEKDSKASQRLISQNSGFSIGKVNYCLKALIDIGFIKIHRFNNSNKKLKKILKFSKGPYLHSLLKKKVKK